MQRSSTLNPGAPTSPRRSGADHAGSSASPRSDPLRIAPRSPNARPELFAPLRMGDFYGTDAAFKQLRDALRPDTKARFPFPLAILEELQKTIEVGVRDAERLYTAASHAECALRLQAAKANQVALLGKIDDTPDSELGGDKRLAVRGSCVALGDMLTGMMIRVESLAGAKAPDARRAESDDDSSQPPSPGAEERPKEKSPIAQKRAQGDQDSPVLTHSPPKRQKITTPTASASATTTAPQSPPAYRPLPQPALSPDPEHARPATVTEANAQPVLSPSVRKFPQKQLTLRSQPRPRQLSQRYAAPPEPTGRQQDGAIPRKPAPDSPQPGTALQ